jgi:hypothetical protein
VPLDRIVLKGGTQTDIEAAVAGVMVDGEGDALIHYRQTDIVLTGIQPSDVAADWLPLRQGGKECYRESSGRADGPDDSRPGQRPGSRCLCVARARSGGQGRTGP